MLPQSPDRGCRDRDSRPSIHGRRSLGKAATTSTPITPTSTEKGNDISTVEESLHDRTVDGFRLAYDRRGRGPGAPVVLLLHGWPRDRTDYREVVPLVSATADVVVPDPRGFG